MTDAAKGAGIARIKENVEALIGLESQSDELVEPKQQY